MYRKELGFLLCDAMTRKTRKLTKLVTVNDLSHVSLLAGTDKPITPCWRGVHRRDTVPAAARPRGADKRAVHLRPSPEHHQGPDEREHAREGGGVRGRPARARGRLGAVGKLVTTPCPASPAAAAGASGVRERRLQRADRDGGDVGPGGRAHARDDCRARQTEGIRGRRGGRQSGVLRADRAEAWDAAGSCGRRRQTGGDERWHEFKHKSDLGAWEEIIDVSQKGTLVLELNNEYSLLNSKSVKYGVAAPRPSDARRASRTARRRERAPGACSLNRSPGPQKCFRRRPAASPGGFDVTTTSSSLTSPSASPSPRRARAARSSHPPGAAPRPPRVALGGDLGAVRADDDDRRRRCAARRARVEQQPRLLRGGLGRHRLLNAAALRPAA